MSTRAVAGRGGEPFDWARRGGDEVRASRGVSVRYGRPFQALSGAPQAGNELNFVEELLLINDLRRSDPIFASSHL
jgi:hypothetical protein